MAITTRIGLEEDFDPFKMTTGEIAITLNGKMFYCTSPGVVKEVITKEDFQELLTSIEDAKDKAQLAVDLVNSLVADKFGINDLVPSVSEAYSGVKTQELIDNITFDNATTTTDGLMSKEDKIQVNKISGIEQANTELVNAVNDVTNKTIDNSYGFGVMSGLFVTPQTTPNMTVKITAGKAYVDNGNFNIDEVLSQSITAADATNPRYDIVYVGADGIITYEDGVAASAPIEPIIPGNALKLAKIFVPAGATSITPQNISDSRIWKGGKWVGVYNGHSGDGRYGIGISTCATKEKWSGSPSKFLDWRSKLFDNGGLSAPCIIEIDGLLYIYYTALYNSKLTVGLVTCTKDYRIISRPRYQVLSYGTSGAWDDLYAARPFVIKTNSADPSKKYAMFYEGGNSSLRQGGMAYSPDGIKWTKYTNNPVLAVSAGQWDSTWIYCEHIVKVNATYYMIYSGYDGSSYKLGVATATDLEGPWTKDASNPVLIPRTSANKSITSDASTGSTVINVGDSSVFSLDEPCYIGYGVTYENVKIKSKPSGSTVELYEPLVGAFTVTNSSRLKSAYSLSVGANHMEYEGNTWKVYCSAWGAAGNYESTFLAEGVSLTALDYSYKKSPVMNYDTTTVENWDCMSQENLKFIFVRDN